MHILDKIDFPPMLRVRQKFNPTRLRDVEGAILDQIRDLGPQLPISPGQSVALACPSRGLADYPLTVKSVVAGLRELKLEPLYVFAQLLDYYGMVKESKEVYKKMDKVIFEHANSLISPDNLRAELEQEEGEDHPGPHYIVAAYPRPVL